MKDASFEVFDYIVKNTAIKLPTFALKSNDVYVLKDSAEFYNKIIVTLQNIKLRLF